MDLQVLLNKSKTRLSEINPILAEKGRALIKLAYGEGIYMIYTQGLRSIDYQNQLYAQGRTIPGNIITQVKGGYSYHNYGLAIDFALLADDGVNISWKIDKRWLRVGALGEGIGLEWGGSWTGFVDMPHFQLTFGLSTADLRAGKTPPKQPEVVIASVPSAQKEEIKLDAKVKEEAIKAIDALAAAGMLKSPEYWKTRIEENIPVWAYMLMESYKLKA